MKSRRFFIVVPAAGIGQRMQSHCPKQYLTLAGSYLADHTLSRLLAVGSIERLVVALHPDDQQWSQLQHASHPAIVTCEGGDTRAASVLAALDCLVQLGAAADDRVLVHDMARPCVRVADIQALMAADNDEGAILAAPVVDTIKLAADQSGRYPVIDRTLDRQRIWRAFTPQLFPLERLRQALLAAQQQGRDVTDEASAIEWLGGKPRLVMGNEDNVKVTHPADLALAAFHLQQQAGESAQ